ncbi:hypothetical protein VYU27_006015 [Nannochloropsis oceanica]
MASLSSSSSSLVHQLAACFAKDPLIDEYDFVLLPSPSDLAKGAPIKDTMAFVLEAHKLGIATWALKPIFKEALHMIRRITTASSKARERGETGQDDEKEDMMVDEMATRALLLINPDTYTAWNVRKRLIVGGYLSAVDELAFIDLIFSKYTKKASAWAHRRWCVSRLLEHLAKNSRKVSKVGEKDQHHQQQQQWCWSQQREKELEVTAKIAEALPKNYHAWTHRWRVVRGEDVGICDVHWEEKGLTLKIETSDEEKKEEAALWQQEVEFVRGWTGRHVGDMAAMNYLQQVLTHAISVSPSPPSSSSSSSSSCSCCSSCISCSSSSIPAVAFTPLSKSEREQNQSLARLRSITSSLNSLLELNFASLDTYPGHESLWYQRRGLLELWMATMRRREVAGSLSSSPFSSSSSSSTSAIATAAAVPPSYHAQITLYNAEMDRGSHYMQGERPWEGGEGGREGGLLWDAAAKRKQKLSAWAHRCWMVLRWRKGEGWEGKGAKENERAALWEELMALEASDSLLFVPPGYKCLLLSRGMCERDGGRDERGTEVRRGRGNRC